MLPYYILDTQLVSVLPYIVRACTHTPRRTSPPPYFYPPFFFYGSFYIKGNKGNK